MSSNGETHIGVGKLNMVDMSGSRWKTNNQVCLNKC